MFLICLKIINFIGASYPSMYLVPPCKSVKTVRKTVMLTCHHTVKVNGIFNITEDGNLEDFTNFADFRF